MGVTREMLRLCSIRRSSNKKMGTKTLVFRPSHFGPNPGQDGRILISAEPRPRVPGDEEIMATSKKGATLNTNDGMLVWDGRSKRPVSYFHY